MKSSLTYELNGLPNTYREVLGYYTLSAKNIRNSSLFIIKNLRSCYRYENKSYILIDVLHENQKEILNYVNHTITLLNQKRTDKYNAKINEANEKGNNSDIKASEKSEEAQKLPKLFNLYSGVIDKNTYMQILDITLLENVIKYKESKSEFKDFTVVHSNLAQSVVHNLCDDFHNASKAIKAYNISGDGFNGRPEMPDYKGKSAVQSFSISAQNFTDKGQVIRIGKKHTLYKDYNKKRPVLKDLSIPFNDFNLLDSINKDIEKRNLANKIGVEFKIVQVRVIAAKYKQLPTVQYVVSFERELEGFFPEILAKSRELKNKDFYDLKDNEKLEVVTHYFNNDYKDDVKNHNLSQSNKDIPYFMAADLGVVNFATISYFTKDKNNNLVISGKKLKKKIALIDEKIDKRKKELTTLNVRDIQGKKDRVETLTRFELSDLKEYHKALSVDKVLLRYQKRKSNLTMDYIHKLSCAMVEDCISKGIKIIIVGKNKGWKSKINIGAKNNRAMYNFPHAKFIEILKYKAMLKNVLVIETEESYTSKTSFVDNEELQEFKITQDIKHQLSGRRIDRRFITKDKVELHADVNGAFNIGRKILKNFCYDKNDVTLKYQLVELSMFGSKYYVYNKKYNASL